MINMAIICGYLGKDPEIRTMQNGDKVATFSVATTEKWRDRNSGERKEKTEWHNIAVWNEGLVKVIEQYVKKGTLVHITGALQTRKWQDQSGNDRYSTEIVLKFDGKLTLMPSGERNGNGDGGNRGGNNRNNNDEGGNGGGYGNQSRGGGNGGGGRNFSRDLDDEIPF